MATATMGSPMTRNEALAWCVDRLDGWPTQHSSPPGNAPAGWAWGKEPPLPSDAPRAWTWALYDPSHKFGPITQGDVMNRRNHPPEPTTRPAMTRNEALAWCVEMLDDWPVGQGGAPHHVPSGWEWMAQPAPANKPTGWVLAEVGGSDSIYRYHWRDARNIRDLNSIGKARTMSFQACGVSADIGQRVRVETDVHAGRTGTLAGVYGDQIWLVDISGHGGGMTVFRANEITGFARVTDRDQFIDRAVEVMFKGNPAMSKHVARSSAVSMWSAGARFTDQGDE